MFEGEKTALFWIGLGILGFASTFILFNSLWNVVLQGLQGRNAFLELQYQVPHLADGIVFTLIGLYMMKSGVKKREK
jgi:hypothetical protein